MVQIRLLGGISAASDDGRALDLGPAKCQAVLAALAVSAGSSVPVSRLVEMVWGADPPRTAEKTLQSYVTRLRKSLGSDAIVRTGAAYLLDVEGGSVDVVRFQRHLDAGDTAAALAEWTGHPLAGLDAEGLAPTADRLVEQWLGATEADLEQRIDIDAAGAVGALTELTARHPFREGLWALLMRALYRAGRQADALGAYRRARQHLVDELGVEPGPRLRELESMVLAHDERLGTAASPARPAPPRGAGGDAPAPAAPVLDDLLAEQNAARIGPEPPPPITGDERRGNLPHRLGRLIGRDEDLGLVAQALTIAPVVTLVGPGGIGKTRLALAAARAAEPDLAGGAWLVELAGITDPADVPRAVADALDVRESPERTLAGSIVAALRSRHAIVVLDNCEHVVEGAADLARAIAEGCPDARILATSREGLGLPGERLIAIGPLDPDGAAAELFDERAAAADRSFDAVAGRDAVREICRRLDGVPLAIELAAARARSLSVAGLLERLDDRLRLLTGGRRTDAERHRTLRATIQWSYDLLPPPERDLFAQLSVFAGRFDLAAAEAVTAVDDAGAVDELLGALVDRSMVIVGDGRFGRRFRLLETMRQFGAERLAEAGAAEAAADRHARWCLDEVARVGGLLAGLGEIEGVARLDALWPDLRAALERACARGDAALARALVGPVAPEVLLRGRSEIGDWAERILEITAPGDVEMIAFALAWAAQRHTLTQDHEAYERLVRRHGEPDHPLVHHARAFLYEDYPRLAEWTPQAVAALRAAGEDHPAEFYEMDVGAALLNLGRLDEHDALVGELAGRYRRQGPPTLLNWSLMLLGYSARFQGEGERAERIFDEAIDVELPRRTRSPNRPIEARALFRRGDRAAAFRLLRAHVVELLEEDGMHGADITAVEFVDMMARSDRLPEAARMLGYLEATNLLDTPAFRALVADAASAVAASGGAEDEQAAGRALDDRGALAFMRDALEGVAG